MRVSLLATVALCAASLAAHATVLDQQTSGTNPNAAGYFGQTFVVTGTDSFTDITFNFYSYPGASTPYAAGTGYLFSQPYGGTPAGLSALDPNFLGSAGANNGLYNFGSSVTLTGGHDYYFYEDADLPGNAISGQAAAEQFFYSPDTATSFTAYGQRSNNYEVTGNTPTSPVPTSTTPEPASFALFATGLLGVTGIARRRAQLSSR